LKRAYLLILGALVAACGSDGEQGPPGDPGAPGQPAPPGSGESVSLVTPRYGVLARKAQITIAVDSLKLGANPTVSFGDNGVKITSVNVLNAAAIVADVEIAADAKVGPRDVTVTDGGKTMVATAAFEVVPALQTKVSGGKAEQGGLVRLDFVNRDRIPLVPDTFRLMSRAKAGVPTVSPLGRGYLTATDGQFILFGDPLAPAGALQLEGINDPEDPDSATFLTAPDALTVAARAPKAVTPGTPLAGEVLAGDLATGFYKFAAPANAIVDIRIANLGTKILPVLDAMPAVGTIGAEYDYRDATNRPGSLAYVASAASPSEFLVVSDGAFKGGPAADYKYDLTVRTVPGTVTPESATAHPAATPQDLGTLPAANAATPAVIVNGEIITGDTADVYRVDAGGTSRIQLVGMTEENLIIRFHPTNPACPSNSSTSLNISVRADNIESTANVGAGFVCVLPRQGSKGKYTIAVRRLP